MGLLIGVDLGSQSLSDGFARPRFSGSVLLRREKVEITAWEFFKIGMIAMPVALIGSLLVLWN